MRMKQLENKKTEPKRLSREFFVRDGLTVAQELLGKILVHETEVGTIRGIITEVEAYMGEEDKGSHTYGGRRTERTEPMYHVGGTSYVYLIYGMYSCMNISTATDGVAQAVLLRSVIPADEESEQKMIALRLRQLNTKREKKGLPAFSVDDCPANIKRNLANGPGKMCIAMGISKADNFLDMVESESFYVTEGITIDPLKIQVGKRIGIEYAEEAADFLWRYYVEKDALEL